MNLRKLFAIIGVFGGESLSLSLSLAGWLCDGEQGIDRLISSTNLLLPTSTGDWRTFAVLTKVSPSSRSSLTRAVREKHKHHGGAAQDPFVRPQIFTATIRERLCSSGPILRIEEECESWGLGSLSGERCPG